MEHIKQYIISLLKVIKNAANGFSEHKVLKMSAALAYTTMFSMGPLLLVIPQITIAFLWCNRKFWIHIISILRNFNYNGFVERQVFCSIFRLTILCCLYHQQLDNIYHHLLIIWGNFYNFTRCRNQMEASSISFFYHRYIVYDRQVFNFILYCQFQYPKRLWNSRFFCGIDDLGLLFFGYPLFWS